jgi:hypothetical protein
VRHACVVKFGGRCATAEKKEYNVRQTQRTIAHHSKRSTHIQSRHTTNTNILAQIITVTRDKDERSMEKDDIVLVSAQICICNQ